MREMDTAAIRLHPNLEGPPLQNVQLLHASHPVLSWPPRALLPETRPSLSGYESARSCPYIEIIWARKNLQTPGCFPDFPNPNLALNLCVFPNSTQVWGPLRWGTLIFLRHQLLACLDRATVTLVLGSECLPHVVKAGGNVRLCQPTSRFARETFWHICVTSKCLSKLLKKKKNTKTKP